MSDLLFLLRWMMRDANPDRVGTRPIRDDVAAHTDTFPEEWCNE